MDIILTRRKLINIINAEPLAPGSFLSEGNRDAQGRTERPDSGTPVAVCIGCAVGQSFRNLISGKEDASKVEDWLYKSVIEGENASSDGNLSRALEEKNWLLALSIKFESLAENTRFRKLVIRSKNHPVKVKLVNFIKANFPAKLTVDIDGFAPRRPTKAMSKERQASLNAVVMQ